MQHNFGGINECNGSIHPLTNLKIVLKSQIVKANGSKVKNPFKKADFI
jgi:hypothetical protein